MVASFCVFFFSHSNYTQAGHNGHTQTERRERGEERDGYNVFRRKEEEAVVVRSFLSIIRR